MFKRPRNALIFVVTSSWTVSIRGQTLRIAGSSGEIGAAIDSLFVAKRANNDIISGLILSASRSTNLPLILHRRIDVLMAAFRSLLYPPEKLDASGPASDLLFLPK